jgi:hypothetical protein
VIEESQVVVHEGEEPDFIAHLLDTDVLAGEDQTEIDLSLAETDPAAVGDGDSSVMKWVVELAKAAIGAW